MPNWTRNSISVEGPKEVLDKMLADGKANEQGVYAFSSWIPMPETYHKYDTTNHPNGEGLRVGEHVNWDKDSPIVTEELIEEFKQATIEQKQKYGVVGWYDWNCANYGCKWDMDFDYLERISDTELTIEVDTPWSAPNVFLLRMSQRYPELTFTADSHYEEGEWEILEFHAGGYDQLDCGLEEWREEMDAEYEKEHSESE